MLGGGCCGLTKDKSFSPEGCTTNGPSMVSRVFYPGLPWMVCPTDQWQQRRRALAPSSSLKAIRWPRMSSLHKSPDCGESTGSSREKQRCSSVAGCHQMLPPHAMLSPRNPAHLHHILVIYAGQAFTENSEKPKRKFYPRDSETRIGKRSRNIFQRKSPAVNW
jgi:hypothetical protein